MEKAQFIGYRKTQFEADGKTITGYKYNVMIPMERKEGQDGYSVMSFFISSDKMIKNGITMPELGSELELEYNRFGKVEKFSKVTK